jgi:hypothetical protein
MNLDRDPHSRLFDGTSDNSIEFIMLEAERMLAPNCLSSIPGSGCC